MSLPNPAAFHTVAIFGVYLPALVLWAGASLVPYFGLRWLFDRFGLYRFVWHRPLFNLALYVVLVGGVVYLGNIAWL
jgi:hypothetical protein